ncbi:hypothetical protein Ancab_032486 [Ancistrocladus abbreviatus]
MECTDPLKEELRQTMLNQELVFRTQVYELHRLYGIQKTLMEEFKQELASFNLMKRSPQSTSAPLKTAGYDILVTGRTFSAATGANSMWPGNQKFWEEQHQNLHYKRWYGYHDITRRRLDLHLSADEFISNTDDRIPEKGSIWNSFKAPTGLQSPLHVERVSDLKDVKLSLSTRENICRKSEDGKKKCWIPLDVIDLEDPSSCFSENNAYPVVPSSCAASCSSQGSKRNLTHGMTDSIDFGASCARALSFGSGFNGQQCETLTTDFIERNQLSASCRAFELDLNKVQVDSSSCFSNNSVVLNSISGLSGVSQQIDLLSSVDPSLASSSSRKSSIDCIVENPIVHRQDGSVLNLSLINSADKIGESLSKEGAKCRGADGSKVELIDLETLSGLSFHAGEKPFIHRSEPRNESIGLQPRTLADLSCDEDQLDAAVAQVKLGDAENIVFSRPCQRKITAEDLNLSDSCKCDNNADNQSSSIRTMQSGIECGDSHLSTSDETQKASLLSQVEGSPLGEPDQRSSDSTESNHQYIDQKEQAEVDELVQRAAELLVCIALENPVNQQDGSMKVASEDLQMEYNEPRHSCDSYEAIVLELTECSPEEYSVTSKAFDVSESDKRDFSYRLKRGTRMRDFQKDILPGLSTLSRHEICEDINIMESVIRSREYRKMRSKMDDIGAWSKTRRSRRTRTNYGRRYYA